MDLSILIPSRNEMFLARTVRDILEHHEADTEVIAVIDGREAGDPVPEDPRVRVVRLEYSIGQRAAANLAARMSTATYVMKVDAHCAFAQGFDRIMIEAMQGHDDWTMVPIMRNLHVFDWVCPNGHRRYQGPSGPCTACGEPTTRDVVWIAKTNPASKSYCFDPEPHFQYFREFSKRPEGQGKITETMSLQGSCWMLTRERYWDLGVCEEAFGSWGSQGIEVAVKSWLSGGRVVCNQKTWYGHCFRTQGGDFGFPYPMSGHQVEHAKGYARDLFFNNRWPKQVRPLSWLIEKFWPVPGWTHQQLAELYVKQSQGGRQWLSETDREGLQDSQQKQSYETHLVTSWQDQQKTTSTTEIPFVWNAERTCPGVGIPSAQYATEHFVMSTLTPLETGGSVAERRKGLLYYTDNRLSEDILVGSQISLSRCVNSHELVSVSLKPMEFGHNIVLKAERGPLTLFRQILAGLEAMTADVVFFVEHDVLYHPSHFEFMPPSDDVFYYNTNVWKVRYPDGHAVWTDDLQQTSGLCAYRKLLLDFYRQRVAQVEREGFNRHYEPGPKLGPQWKTGNWQSVVPNIDIRHDGTLTRSKWKPEDFRNPRYARGWKESDTVPGWGRTEGCFTELLERIAGGRGINGLSV